MQANTRLVIFAVLMATFSIFALIAAPAAAMPLTPSLQYPQKKEIWGCSFFGNCRLNMTQKHMSH